jgi:hypothetical protein
MMKAVLTSEKSTNFNMTTRCYIPEDSPRNSSMKRLHIGGDRSQKIVSRVELELEFIYIPLILHGPKLRIENMS